MEKPPADEVRAVAEAVRLQLAHLGLPEPDGEVNGDLPTQYLLGARHALLWVSGGRPSFGLPYRE